MIMFERSRRLREPLRWGARERLAVAACIGCALAAVIALGVYALTSGSRPRAGCIDVTFASSVGAAQLHGCGSRARQLCSSGAFPGISEELHSACSAAHLPYRAPA